jgi:HK97 family phage major capsid protein
MSDNERLDQLLQKVTELTSTVKGRAGDATLNKDFIEAQFTSLHKEISELQAKANRDNDPVRRVPGQDVPPVALENIKSTNRYKPFVKGFEKDGQFKWGGQVIKPLDLWIAKSMMNAQQKSTPAFAGGVGKAASHDLDEVVKALTSTTAGAGDELVPTMLAGDLWEDIYLQSLVVPNLTRIPMPSNPFDIPLGLTDPTWYKAGENAAVSESTPTTAKSTLTATEIATELNWSYTMEEDAVIAMAPELRMTVARSGAETMDGFALNADATSAATGNINSDDAAPAANSYYLSAGQDGIRHQWLVDNTAMGSDENGALTDTTITTTLALMGKYAVRSQDLVFFCDAKTYLNGFLVTGSGAPGEYVSTIDKFGPDAIIRTGQLAAYRGIPIVVTSSQNLTQADGKVNSAGSNTKGQISIVNTRMWYVGMLRDLLVEMDTDIRKRQYIMVASFREAISTRGTRSSNTHTAGIYNITV